MRTLIFAFLSLILLSAESGQKPEPKISIAEEYDFGEMTLNEPETALLIFENMGDAPLKISNCTVACKCIEVTWPKEEVLPGKSDTIKLAFDAAKTGDLKKNLYVTTNEVADTDAWGNPIYKRHLVRLLGYVNTP